MINSTPTLVRFFWPPDIPFIMALPIITSAQSCRPSRMDEIIHHLVNFFLSIGAFRATQIRAELERFLRSSSGHQTVLLHDVAYVRKLTGLIVLPPTVILWLISKLSTVVLRPAKILSRELLPAPDGPRMAHVSPPFTLPQHSVKIGLVTGVPSADCVLTLKFTLDHSMSTLA